MSEELERLRADLERLEEYGRMMIETNEKVLDKIRDRIRELEADADPWREAKQAVELHLASGGHRVKEVARYARHLESENARLKAENDAFRSEPYVDENGHMVFPEVRND